MGVIALEAGDRERAFAEWKQAVAADPRNFDALYNLASELLQAGRIEEARVYVDRFVSTAPPAMYGRDIERLKSAR
jgi:Tfp pilus assembly protein PilF